MFEHSIKVPRLYKNAAKILQEVKEKRASLKQLVYQSKHRNIKATYALVAETLKHFSQIDTLIEKSELLVKENRFDPWLARILITELLWKGKQIRSESKPIKTILSYYDVLEKHKIILDSNTEQKTIEKVQKPRFVRINTLAISLEEAINGFREEGWTLIPSSSGTYDEFVSKTSCLRPDEFMIDLHVKELLLFPFNTQFYNHNAYRKGLIILQDKASCLPAGILNPPPGSTVLDMCAAPGMKTTHVAALLGNKGTVYAVEQSEKRFNTLNKIVENAGATCVKTLNKNVMDVTAEECPNVEYILVDPSCSGSGITDRVEIDDEKIEVTSVRLHKLSGFQKVVLRHALTGFPQAKRVVYSTCSIYPEENENVVRAMKDIRNFKLISAKYLLNGPWKNSESENRITKKCLYTKPEKDLTDGFFIAVFQRVGSQGPNQLEDGEEEEVLLQLDDMPLKKEHEKNTTKYVDEESKIIIKQEPQNDIDFVKATTAYANDDDSLVPKKKNKKKIKEIEEYTENSAENYENVVVTAENVEEIIPPLEPHKKHKKKKRDLQKDEKSVNEETIEVDKVKTEGKIKVEPTDKYYTNTMLCEEQECKDEAKKNKKHKSKRDLQKDGESVNEETMHEMFKVKEEKKIKVVSAGENTNTVLSEKEECNEKTKKSKKHKKRSATYD